MKVEVLGSTKLGYRATIEESLRLAGIEAGICYMPGDFKDLLYEPIEKTQRRVNGTVLNGHHSVAGHPSYNLVIRDAPKILAMLINNEKEYNTSEKSGRYTTMTTEGEERQLYEKWQILFAGLIAEEYPEIPARQIDKLAKENARYFISIFTPATTMGYTVSLRQANYLIGFCEQTIDKHRDDSHPFYRRLLPYLEEFTEGLKRVLNVEGMRAGLGRGFSLFAPGRQDANGCWVPAERETHFGDTYSVNYLGSFMELAQAQRHRSIWYEMSLPEEEMFFIPPILKDNFELQLEYMNDMQTIVENFPQGRLVEINERGTIEAFWMKCHERLCGAAQLEICQQTRRTLWQYLLATNHRASMRHVSEKLDELAGKTKCQMGFNCRQPCPLGPEQAFSRKI